jgi:hypothetical protein
MRPYHVSTALAIVQNYSVALSAALFNDFHPKLQLVYAMLLLPYFLIEQLQSSARAFYRMQRSLYSMKCFNEAFIEQQHAKAANTLQTTIPSPHSHHPLHRRSHPVN